VAKTLGILLGISTWISLDSRGTAATAAEELRAQLTTSQGEIEVRLLAARAPRAVGAFVALARRGAFDGTKVLRILPGLTVELGGGREGGADTGPGYCLDDEIDPELLHDKAGVVSMADAGPDAGVNRFLITLAPAPRLDGKHAVFGEVSKGMDVLSRIGAAKVVGTRPVEPIVITKVTIAGELASSLPEPTRELGKAEVDKLASDKARELATGIGRTLGLGKLQRLAIVSARSRCEETQAEYEADFGPGGKGARLLLYGRASGAGFDVQQFQFGRGSAP
jgi:cyclophilin family peptidyl-prolyl cis-trans isomerase